MDADRVYQAHVSTDSRQMMEMARLHEGCPSCYTTLERVSHDRKKTGPATVEKDTKSVLVNSMSTWHKLESFWRKEAQMRKCSHYVGLGKKPVERFLDWWWKWEGPDHYTLVLHGRSKLRKPWRTSYKQHSSMVSVQFVSPSSCLEFLAWAPHLMNYK